MKMGPWKTSLELLVQKTWFFLVSVFWGAGTHFPTWWWLEEINSLGKIELITVVVMHTGIWWLGMLEWCLSMKEGLILFGYQLTTT
jgi:hypothetical protein